MRRLARHRLEHDRLQIGRHPRVELPRDRRVVVHQPVQERGAIGLIIGRLAADQLVERDAQAVDIGPLVASAGEPLRRHVTQRPDHIAGVG